MLLNLAIAPRRASAAALFMALVLSTAVSTTASADPAPSLSVRASRNVEFRSADDVLNATTASFAEWAVQWGVYPNTNDPLDLTVQLGVPTGTPWSWSGPASSYQNRSASAGTLTRRTIAPVSGGGWWGGAELPGTRAGYSGPVTVSRSMSNPVLSGDSVMRTLTIELDITPGSMAGMEEVAVMLPNWENIEGLSTTVVGSTYDTSAFVSNGSDWYGYSGDPALLGGTYTFELDLAIERSGPLAQAAVGDLYHKPPVHVAFGDFTGNTTTGTPVGSALLNLAGGMSVAVKPSTPAFFNMDAFDRTTLNLGTVVAQANSPAAPSEILFVVGRNSAPGFGHVYEAVLSVTGENLVGGSLTTPGAQTYPIDLDTYNGETELDFNIISTDMADISEFVPGVYTLRIWGGDGVAQTYNLTLAGELPTDNPDIDLPLNAVVTEAQPTLTASTSTDPDVNLAVFGVESADESFYDEVFLDPASDPMALTPSQPLPEGGVEASAIFAEAVESLVSANEGTVLDVPLLTAFYTRTATSFNAVYSAVAGDFNGDGVVNTEDINPFILALTNIDGFGVEYALHPAAYDLNGDGVVNTEDINFFITTLTGSGEITGDAAVIPEPATGMVMVLMVGAAGMIRRCR